jgi:hypothetical protein
MLRIHRVCSLYFITLLFTTLYGNSVSALNLTGRLGMGMSNQFANGLPAISFKVQNSSSSAYGGLVALDSNTDNTDFGLGVKGYRLLFDEPHLNFFLAGMAGMLKKNDISGYQIDGTMGSEFHIPGLESIGFSFEFGLSFNKVENVRHFETAGYQFVTAAVHFYL